MSDQVQTHRVYTWAIETRFVGQITTNTVSDAALQYRQIAVPGKDRVWLLDAGAATGIAPDALAAIGQHVMDLHAMGLDRIAIVINAMAVPFLSMAGIDQERVRLFPFTTRDEAAEWLRRGCR